MILPCNLANRSHPCLPTVTAVNFRHVVKITSFREVRQGIHEASTHLGYICTTVVMKQAIYNGCTDT